MRGTATGATLDDVTGGQSSGARAGGVFNRWVAVGGTLQQLTRIKRQRELSRTWPPRCHASALHGSIVSGYG
ncbi:MAG: hypothetical protein ACLP7Q_07820 [Isosphaeraceae bacterium]